MSKQEFTETLKFGKCRCGAAGTAGSLCPTTGVKKCPCCDNCRHECQSFMDEMYATLKENQQAMEEQELLNEQWEQENSR